MRLANYVFIPDFLSEKECDRIRKEGQKRLEPACVVDKNTGKDSFTPELERRNSNVSWFDKGTVIEDLLQKVVDGIRAYAQRYYAIDITRAGLIQYTEYEKGMFYTWHTDSSPILECEMVRDISASVILSKKNDYKGGSLQMVFPDNIKDNVLTPQDVENQEQGTLIVFPSNMIHRVSKVISGVRSSLVVWTWK